MKIPSIIVNHYTSRGKLNIPKSVNVNEIQKQDYIEELNAMHVASIFKEFEDNLRTVMETFVYTIKH